MEELNRIVKKEIEEYEIKSIDELILHERCSDIIISNPLFLNIEDYKKRYSIYKNFQLSYEFLNDFNYKYAEQLLKRLDEKAFILEKYTKDSISRSDMVNGVPKIYIPNIKKLILTYNITHEFIHDMTIMHGYNNTRMSFCEVFSLYAEIMQSKYLEDRKIKEATLRSGEIFNHVYSKAIKISFELKLIKAYLKEGMLTYESIAKIIEEFPPNINVWPIYDEILEDKKLTFGYEHRYIIGYLLAQYMLDRNIDNKNKEFFELNDNINNYSIPKFIETLELKGIYGGMLLNFNEDSYERLEKAYIKQIKNIRR